MVNREAEMQMIAARKAFRSQDGRYSMSPFDFVLGVPQEPRTIGDLDRS
jgi:hypothetical protein